MRLEFEQALYPCLATAGGLTILGVGGAVIGPIVGGTLVGSAGSLCAVHIALIMVFRKIYNDPPDPAFGTLAHVVPAARPSLNLPSCDGLDAKDKKLCKRIE